MTAEQELTHDILDSIAEGLFTVDKDFKINISTGRQKKSPV